MLLADSSILIIDQFTSEKVYHYLPTNDTEQFKLILAPNFDIEMLPLVVNRKEDETLELVDLLDSGY